MPRTVVLFSGGVESTVVAHQLRRQGHELRLLAIDYGQRHRREHESARLTADRLGASMRVVDLQGLGGLLPGNSLTDRRVEVPDYDPAVRSREFVVPNRNAILLTVAVAAAVAEQADQVAIGSIAGDAETGDCTREFVAAFNAMEGVATAEFVPDGLSVVAPLVSMQKSDVIHLGESLGVRWEDTWSCFRGEEKQCGTCATCHDRRRAFRRAGVQDPTEYARD
ncbi:7-cyano-7-deazaguanine synthase QueC [Streptantibioticus rubrisoli]|uniref:7-cyano-7-deazaguanine synthase n=1 Tax=Streptantibioticus rubrisoli TaxID=1387313 RepID=A0ABT1P580_9ACTN|nr:7-cyano-7-deazaguanine synthase QueC [Streptantibioticus rubrisoli]MCQ4040527.1 7-cyano-7-deazaguanine synthase QueC [Streptantibioticus rubrisoli]